MLEGGFLAGVDGGQGAVNYIGLRKEEKKAQGDWVNQQRAIGRPEGQGHRGYFSHRRVEYPNDGEEKKQIIMKEERSEEGGSDEGENGRD